MARRVVLAVAVLVVLGLGLGAAYVVHLVRSVDTPAFRQYVLDRASAAVGAKVQARRIEISLWRGVTIEGIRVVNPAPFPGDLLDADALVLRYNPWVLLEARVELSRLQIRKPVLTIAMDSRGTFNYEHLEGPKGDAAHRSQGNDGLPVAVVLSRMTVDDARLVVRDPRALYMKVEGASLDSSLDLTGGSVQGRGTVRVGTVNLSESLFVRSVSAPFTASKGVMTLAPIQASVAKGTLRGDVRVQTEGALRFTTNVTVDGAELQTLLEEAKAAQSASGVLSAKATITGSGGVATLKGQGHAEVKQCKVAHAALLGLLSEALRVPELAHPEFEQCRTDFTLGDGRLVTPTLVLKGAALELTGHGSTRLDTLALDYDMTLALGKALLDRIPVRELRAAFKPRGDGFETVDFRVTGTTTAPQTDLTARLGKAAASQAAESGLKKILKKGKIF